MGITHFKGVAGIDGVYEGAKGDERRLFSAGAKFAGTRWFVDTVNGNDRYSGKSWNKPFITMQKAFNSLSSGDAIYFRGKVKEQLTTPVRIFDVAIYGASLRPRHIDGTPKAGSQSTAMWTESTASPATPLCIVQQQGWRFVNILFAGPADASCIQLYRDAGSGDDERDGSHAEFHNCRFASGQDAIEQSGGCGHVGIYNCFITSMTGYAIKNTSGAGIGYPIRWELIGNRFLDNVNVLKMACIGWNVRNNSFMTTTTEVFDTDNGDAAAGKIVVVDNFFNVAKAAFDPTGNVEGNSTDVWSNICNDGREEGTPAD